MLINLLIGVLLITSIVIIIQDFKERKISLIAILLFGALCFTITYLYQGFDILKENSLNSFLYILLLWLSLTAIISIKNRKLTQIIDNQIGLGDVFLLFFIGITFDALSMVVFFSASFIFSLALSLILIKNNNNSSPLAAFLLIFYILVIFIFNFSDLLFFIDCSLKLI